MPSPLFPVTTPPEPTTKPVVRDRVTLLPAQPTWLPRPGRPGPTLRLPKRIDLPPLVFQREPVRPERPTLRANSRYAISTPPGTPLSLPAPTLRGGGVPGATPSIILPPLLNPEGSALVPPVPPTTRPTEMDDPDAPDFFDEDPDVDDPTIPDDDAPVRPLGLPTPPAPTVPTTRPTNG